MSNKTQNPVTPTPASELAGTATLDRGNRNAKLDSLEAVQEQIKVLDEGALQPWTQE